MDIPEHEQFIIISACCFAIDHYGDCNTYAEKFLKREGIEYTEGHQLFTEWYMESCKE